MPPFRLSTLGPPNLIRLPGEPVKFRTRKHFALVIRLAVEPGRRVTRDSLVDLLWPDAPAHHANHSLAQAVSVLKGKIGREHVLVQKATLALAEGAIDADLSHLDECDVDVRGPFLDGFEIPGTVSFEQWKDEWRARLAPRIRDCLVRQMDAGRRIGDFSAVERSAQLLYDLDPLSEDAVRGMMEARAWVGDRGNALKIYARFATRLTDELGAQPGPDLARIANLLREGRPSVPRPAEAAPAPPAPEARREKRFEAETLIGRAKEFAALYDNWLEMRRRRPRVVVLTGDAGVGKTTLTNAFASSCQMEGAIVARAQAYDAERELPFAVLAEVVRQLAVQRAIGCADPEALSELARIAPEIYAVFPGVPMPTDWAAEVTPLRLADAFLKAITAAGDESPVILVVDDVHAADNASAAILHVVARKLESTRVLLILAGRSSELRVSNAAAALTRDTVIGGLRTIELDPLAPEAAAQLVGRLAAGADPRHGEPPAERILRAGSGNPLAIELLTREWAAHGPESLLHDLEALDTLPAPSLGIPRAIRAVFERQVHRLDPRTRAVLDLAAVLGRRLADLSLYAAVECPPGAAGEALSRLREDGILREVRGDLEFRNELIRAQAYYAVAAPARQHLHRRVAELLAEQSGPQRKSLDLEIAWHCIRGGDLERAFSHGLSGAEEALKVGAPYESEQILETLRRHNVPPDMGWRIALMLSKALLDQSKADTAMPLLEELVSTPPVSARDIAEATRLHAVALSLLNRDSTVEHCRVAERAVVAAREANDPELLARALLEYARSGAEAGDAYRIQAAEQELDGLLADPSTQDLHTAWFARGYCHYVFYDVHSAATYMRKAIALLAASPDYVTLALAHNALGACQYYSCEFAQAFDSLSAALGLVKRMGDDFRYSATASNLCSLHILEGNFGEAIRLGRVSVEVGLGIPNQPNLMSSYTNLAEAYLLSGDKERALGCLEAAGKWMQVQGRSWRANIDFMCENANIALMMGNFTVAIEFIAAVETIASGRERAVPESGMFHKLKVFRAEHVHGTDAALRLAEEAQQAFRGRHPVYYLEALAARAWAEERKFGVPTRGTIEELGLFRTLGASGLRSALTAQGFLSRDSAVVR